jgi:CRP-like cAMP-binding protein
MAQPEDVQQAIEDYQRQLAGHPQMTAQSVPLHLTLAKLYERAGQQAAAVQELAQVALFYADEGQYIKAIAAAQLIVRIDPQNKKLLERLEELYFQRGAVSDGQLQEYQEAMSQLDELHSDQAQAADAEQADEGAPVEPEAAGLDVIQALKQTPLFAKLSVSELRGIYANSTLRQFDAHEPVITGGNTQRSLFIILQGSVKIFGKNKDQEHVFLAALEAGNSFGEFALFGRVDPNLSVMADQACTLLEIPRAIVLKLAKARPAITDSLKDLYKHRILDTALARVPLFSQVKPEDRRKILTYFKAVKAKEGATIIREATPGRSMYFILAGKVGVYTSLAEDAGGAGETQEQQLLLATLKSGDFFGERALVTDEPHSATVRALTNVVMLKFSKEDLEVVIQQYPWIESALQIEAIQNMMRKRMSVFNQMGAAAAA